MGLFQSSPHLFSPHLPHLPQVQPGASPFQEEFCCSQNYGKDPPTPPPPSPRQSCGSLQSSLDISGGGGWGWWGGTNSRLNENPHSELWLSALPSVCDWAVSCVGTSTAATLCPQQTALRAHGWAPAVRWDDSETQKEVKPLFPHPGRAYRNTSLRGCKACLPFASSADLRRHPFSRYFSAPLSSSECHTFNGRKTHQFNIP